MLRISITVLLPLLAAGCCGSVASRGDARAYDDGAQARQVFLDMTLARIPEDRVAAVLGDTRLSASAPRDLGAEQARRLLGVWATDEAVHVTQAPKVLALDGQEATVFVGELVQFMNHKATTNAQGGLMFSVDEQPGSPVSLGFRLRATPSIGADGTSISIDLDALSRAAKRELSEPERSEMGVEAFLRDGVYESSLSAHLTMRTGGHVLLGSSEVQEDAAGRHVWVALLHARVLGTADAAGLRIAQR